MNNQKEKRNIRKTKEWKEFRKAMYKMSNKVDRITGKPLRKGWQLHHLDMKMETYAELKPDKFICVNRMTHEMIHWLFRYDNWKECLGNFDYIITKMKEYNK